MRFNRVLTLWVSRNRGAAVFFYFSWTNKTVSAIAATRSEAVRSSLIVHLHLLNFSL